MGNFRFTLGALYEVWRRKRYAARVAFLPVTSSQAAQDTHTAAKGPSPLPFNHTAPAADGWHSSAAAGNSVSGDGGSLTGRHGSTHVAQQAHAGNGPRNGTPSGDLLSKLCPGGPPTPALDALGRAAELDLDSIAERHPVRASVGLAHVGEACILPGYLPARLHMATTIEGNKQIINRKGCCHKMLNDVLLRNGLLLLDI